MTENNADKIPGSFRDPSGFVFKRDEILYRQINSVYKNNYDLLIGTGLYKRLIDSGLLIAHTESGVPAYDPENCYLVIEPEQIEFISYPYEWCFSQLKDVALTTLKIQKIALEHGMSLKDASAYNIQFVNCNPVLIDTLSFEKYKEGQPWVAYKQFCQHFLAPLALMSYCDIRLGSMLKEHIDGFPLDLASKLLPGRTNTSFSLLTHIHLHARSQKHFEQKPVSTGNKTMSRQSLLGLIDNLESAVNKLKWKVSQTEWSDYYNDNNYTKSAIDSKTAIVKRLLEKAQPKKLTDIGGNTGLFSRLASENNVFTISCDSDYKAVEINYQNACNKNERNIIPLVVDITNPSGYLGWENGERISFLERISGGAVMALALIHHLAIGNNVPLVNIAEFFKSICNKLIIEFVPKEDSQVKKMLSARDDVFADYNYENFMDVFSKHFKVEGSESVEHSLRSIHLMTRRQ